MPDVDEVMLETEDHMIKSVQAMEHDFAGYRTGKASPALVENMNVEYYGTTTRLKEIAGITTPEPRLLVIQPWDQNAIAAIEKAIRASNIGISPVSDGRVIRLPVPELSEERRRDLTKQVHTRAEEAKVAIRNLRRDANDAIRQAQKDGDITEDDLHDLQEDVQKLTDNYTKRIEELTEKKEKEIMQV